MSQVFVQYISLFSRLSRVTGRAFCLILAAFISLQAARAEEAVIDKIYRPMGFDDNDQAEVIVSGTLPNQCYRVSKVDAKVITASREIRVKVEMEKYRQFCAQVVTDYLVSADLGALSVFGQDEVSYKVYASSNRLGLIYSGDLPVKRAINENRQDEFLYAPVDSLTVVHMASPNQLEKSEDRVILYGYFPNTCLEFIPESELKFSAVQRPDQDQKMLEVLPILRQTEQYPCLEKKTPFVFSYRLPKSLENGDYLFYVRTMDGYSFYKKDFLPARQALKSRPGIVTEFQKGD